jgi:hypothetical protein
MIIRKLTVISLILGRLSDTNIKHYHGFSRKFAVFAPKGAIGAFSMRLCELAPSTVDKLIDVVITIGNHVSTTQTFCLISLAI